jgi:hypothetical protein
MTYLLFGINMLINCKYRRIKRLKFTS